MNRVRRHLFYAFHWFMWRIGKALYPPRPLAEAAEGCDCTELCEMGPTCPGGMLAGLPGSGCHRVIPPDELVEPNSKLGRNSGRVIPPAKEQDR